MRVGGATDGMLVNVTRDEAHLSPCFSAYYDSLAADHVVRLTGFFLGLQSSLGEAEILWLAAMRVQLLSVVLLWACWAHCLLCMPTFLNRSFSFFAKFGWPLHASELLGHGYVLPQEMYTAEQARDFVTNGLLYLERTMGQHDIFSKLGSGDQVSQSFVYGTDDVPGGVSKPRWRWLPLIDRYDEHGRAVYHTTTWQNGARLKSLDLLRVDYYFSRSMRFLVPTAIVRPILRGGGSGRGLQFTTVYEFPASISRFKRQHTLEAATDLHNAIIADSDRWLALVSPNNRHPIESSYKLLTPEWIRNYLQTTRGRLRTLQKARFRGPEPQGEASSSANYPTLEAAPLQEGWTSSQTSTSHASTQPMLVDTAKVTNDPPAISGAVRGQNSLWASSPHGLTLMRQVDSAPTTLPNTALQLGRDEPHSHIHAPVPLRFTPVQVVHRDPWLRLGTPKTGEADESMMNVHRDADRSGIVPWRRPS